GARKGEELGVDPGADRVDAEIVGPGLAAAGAVEPGQRLRTAFDQRFAKDVAGVSHRLSPSSPTVIPGRPAGSDPEPIFQRLVFMVSGFAAEPVLGPREARTRWRRPGMTTSASRWTPLAAGRMPRLDRIPDVF